MIRSARRDDLSELFALEQRCFIPDDCLSYRNIRDLLKKESAAIYVAEIDKKIVGAIMTLFRKNSKIARLYSIAVDPDYRKQKIAAALCDIAEKNAQQRGCTKMQLEVRVHNTTAISFYEKRQYQLFGKYVQFYTDKTDAFRMEKPL